MALLWDQDKKQFYSPSAFQFKDNTIEDCIRNARISRDRIKTLEGAIESSSKEAYDWDELEELMRYHNVREVSKLPHEIQKNFKKRLDRELYVMNGDGNDS